MLRGVVGKGHIDLAEEAFEPAEAVDGPEGKLRRRAVGGYSTLTLRPLIPWAGLQQSRILDALVGVSQGFDGPGGR